MKIARARCNYLILSSENSQSSEGPNCVTEALFLGLALKNFCRKSLYQWVDLCPKGLNALNFHSSYKPIRMSTSRCLVRREFPISTLNYG